MENAFKQIELTLDRLQGLMAEHIDSFNKGGLPDIENQSFERDRAIQTLKKDVEIFRVWAEKNTQLHTQSTAEYINQRITDLLEMHCQLESRVRNFRDNLKKNMKQLSKGKNAIRSYRSSYAGASTPKVLNITN